MAEGKLPLYEPISFLGIGGFGIVFLLKSPASLEHVAVKFICPQEEEMEKSIKRECETMEDPENQHDNVMKVFRHHKINGPDAYVLIEDWIGRNEDFMPKLPQLHQEMFDGRLKQLTRKGRVALCIEMEPCGTTLRKWFLAHPSPISVDCEKEVMFQTCMRIACEIISGLKFLHSRHITHRDLKPENIYFSYGGHEEHFNFPIKIGDFGQCKEVSATHVLTCSHSMSLTPIYRAKEARFTEVPGKNLRYGKNADWYSVGLILYEVFYCVPLQQLEDSFEMLVLEKELHHTPRAKFSTAGFEGINATIVGLTQEKSEKRQATIDTLLSAFSIQDFLLKANDILPAVSDIVQVPGPDEESQKEELKNLENVSRQFAECIIEANNSLQELWTDRNCVIVFVNRTELAIEVPEVTMIHGLINPLINKIEPYTCLNVTAVKNWGPSGVHGMYKIFFPTLDLTLRFMFAIPTFRKSRFALATTSKDHDRFFGVHHCYALHRDSEGSVGPLASYDQKIRKVVNRGQSETVELTIGNVEVKVTMRNTHKPMFTVVFSKHNPNSNSLDNDNNIALRSAPECKVSNETEDFISPSSGNMSYVPAKDIGSPTNVRHVAHVGVHPMLGLVANGDMSELPSSIISELREIDAQWKSGDQLRTERPKRLKQLPPVDWRRSNAVKRSHDSPSVRFKQGNNFGEPNHIQEATDRKFDVNGNILVEPTRVE